MKRIVAVLAVLASVAAACGGSAIVVGDDTTSASPSTPDPILAPDAAPFDATDPPDGGDPIKVPAPDASDAAEDAPPIDAGCPMLTPPAPGFCDGATPVPLYASNGCVAGYGCAPVACASAGGSCVALTPTSCASGKWGDATKYSCGGGLGVGCCLP